MSHITFSQCSSCSKIVNSINIVDTFCEDCFKEYQNQCPRCEEKGYGVSYTLDNMYCENCGLSEPIVRIVK